MALRASHGNAKAYSGGPRVEVLPPDELPEALPADGEPIAGVVRRQNGTVATSEAAKRLGARGGHVKARRVRLARSLGIEGLERLEAFKPYLRQASGFRRHHTRELAALAGGHVGAAPASFIASAALQLAASRFLFAQGAETGDAAVLKAASQLSNDSRQNLLAAWEIAQREAHARRAHDPSPDPWIRSVDVRDEGVALDPWHAPPRTPPSSAVVDDTSPSPAPTDAKERSEDAP